MADRPPLELHLIGALRALDNQIAREMQRQPSERELHGVQKWEPYARRIENMTGTLLQAVSDREVELDGLLVLTQALAKSLRILVEDLGPEGLGNIRRAYALAAGSALADEARAIQQALEEQAH